MAAPQRASCCCSKRLAQTRVLAVRRVTARRASSRATTPRAPRAISSASSARRGSHAAIRCSGTRYRGSSTRPARAIARCGAARSLPGARLCRRCSRCSGGCASSYSPGALRRGARSGHRNAARCRGACDAASLADLRMHQPQRTGADRGRPRRSRAAARRWVKPVPGAPKSHRRPASSLSGQQPPTAR